MPTQDTTVYEVWYYGRDAVDDYDGCCGHRHSTRRDAARCIRENPPHRSLTARITETTRLPNQIRLR